MGGFDSFISAAQCAVHHKLAVLDYVLAAYGQLIHWFRRALQRDCGTGRRQRFSAGLGRDLDIGAQAAVFGGDDPVHYRFVSGLRVLDLEIGRPQR